MSLSESEFPEELADIMPVVYGELQRLARKHLGGAADKHTLAPTALVNELYLRLLEQRQNAWRNRAQFFGIAARLLRRILVDHARRRGAAKRGGGQDRVPLHEQLAAGPLPPIEDVLTLHEAIAELRVLDYGQAELVEMAYFLGMTAEEIADVTGDDAQHVYHELRIGKAWLRRRMA